MSSAKKAPILPLSPELQALVDRFELPSPLGFGQTLAPVMVRAEFQDGCWSQAEVTAYQSLSSDPAMRALHYGQQVFEGMKAYILADGRPTLFRPLLNHKRLNESASRMAMPEVPRELFMSALESLVYHLAPKIPHGRDESLYIRPFLFASDTGLSLRASTRYTFLVVASPSGAYFNAAKVTALIERQDCRAAPGGTGAYKVAGNYGASIRSSIKAANLGCQQTLWLDAIQKSYVEELSAMNFFAVIDGDLHTPGLTDTILSGITRDCVIQMAKSHQLRVVEAPLIIADLIAAIKSGLCTEIFGSGTAVVVSPVHALAEEDGTVYDLPMVAPEHSLALKLRQELIDIQTGRKVPPDNWLHPLTHSELAFS